MERNWDYTEKWSHCVPFVFNKLRDKKYLIFKVFIWLTYVYLWPHKCICSQTRIGRIKYFHVKRFASQTAIVRVSFQHCNVSQPGYSAVGRQILVRRKAKYFLSNSHSVCSWRQKLCKVLCQKLCKVLCQKLRKVLCQKLRKVLCLTATSCNAFNRKLGIAQAKNIVQNYTYYFSRNPTLRNVRDSWCLFGYSVCLVNKFLPNKSLTRDFVDKKKSRNNTVLWWVAVSFPTAFYIYIYIYVGPFKSSAHCMFSL
jgi:hypothetical protein